MNRIGGSGSHLIQSLACSPGQCSGCFRNVRYSCT
jgi:hypothetical protein